MLLNRSGKTQRDLLRGRTLINLFFEDSTRTRTSFELAGKRLGADVINMSVSTSSVNKGETLLDTAATLNAMNCDLLVVRARPVGGAGAAGAEGGCRRDQRRRRHARAPPTQALLDALTVRRTCAGWRGSSSPSAWRCGAIFARARSNPHCSSGDERAGC